MRKIKLQNEEVDVKDCWSDLTTAEYISLMDLYSESQELLPELFLFIVYLLFFLALILFICSIYLSLVCQ